MKKDVFQKIEVLTNRAIEAQRKDERKEEDRSTQQTVNSLSESITSKEQADTFKKMLALL